MNVNRLLLGCLLVSLTNVAAAAEPLVDPLIEPGERVVFLGDSITYAGGFIDEIDAFLIAKFPGRRYELINVGLPSETASGLSEPNHPFPRPDVNERLARVLSKMRPAVVVACYGMNDGIYHPFSDARFAAYQAGVNKVIAACAAAVVKLILVTPPPYDPLAAPKSTVGRDAKEFGYRGIYKHYDREVIAVYAKWIMQQAERDDVAAVVDLHTPISQYMAAERRKDPAFKMSGDGVHVNEVGHHAIATALAAGLRLEDFGELALDVKRKMLAQQRQRLLRDAWLSETGHTRPGVTAGKPIAAAQREAAALTNKIFAAE